MKNIADELRRLADEIERGEGKKIYGRPLTMKEKVESWFEKNHREYGSAQEWRKAMIAGVSQVATEHAVDVVKSVMSDYTDYFFSDKAYARVANRVRDALRASSGVDSPTSEGCDE